MSKAQSVYGSTPSGSLEVRITVPDGMTDSVFAIFSEVLPDVLAQFVEKARDYDGEFFTADLLGAQGQFADMWRKFGKLHKAMWLGQPLNGEQPEEILGDYIGHVLLSLDYYRLAREQVMPPADWKPYEEIIDAAGQCRCVGTVNEGYGMNEAGYAPGNKRPFCPVHNREGYRV